MTRFEQIKLMSVEEMAEAIYSSKAERCHFCKPEFCSIIKENCIKGIKKWLESEVEE